MSDYPQDGAHSADPKRPRLNLRFPTLRTIGPYRLLQRIGEGGMGEVWLAEQTHPVRRQVALKVIKAGMDTRAGGRPLRGRAAGPGADGPPEHRHGLRRRQPRPRAARTSSWST